MHPAAKAALIGGAVIGAGWLIIRHFEEGTHSERPWTDPRQPPTSLAPEIATVSEAACWAACQPSPMAEPSMVYQTAGARRHRTYPGSLAVAIGGLVRSDVT